MKQAGYAGRKPASFPKHTAWPGVQLDRTKTHIVGTTIKKGSA
jgi:hypothetical protein